jgi:hypothetical protein
MRKTAMPATTESGVRRISARPAAVLTSAPDPNPARRKLEDTVLKISDAAHFRRVVAGLCLVAAPLLFAVAEIATPQPSGSAAAQLASFAQHRDQLLVGVLCGLASSMCFAPALFGLLHKIRDRGVVYAHVAAALIIYGLVTQAALYGINAMFWVMTKPGMNHAAMVNLLNGLQHGPAVAGAPLLAGHYLFAVGMVLLGVAVWRARLAPRWAGILVALWPVADIALSSAGDMATLVSDAIGIAGFAALGWRLLTAPDASWDTPPAIAAEPVPQPHPSAI